MIENTPIHDGPECPSEPATCGFLPMWPSIRSQCCSLTFVKLLPDNFGHQACVCCPTVGCEMLSNDPDEQPAILTIGFRPFFLLAGIYAALSMAAWIAWLMLHSANAVILEPTIAVPAHHWHGHEMLIGFAGAVITGFMLTATPGWTGARRVAGFSLLILSATWLAGRLVMWLSSYLPALLVAAIDMAHLPMLAVSVGLALSRHPQPRNVIFLGLLGVLIIANAAIHLEWLGWSEDTASWGLQIALIDVCLLIVILGGRIIPSFTRNAMMRRGVKNNFPRSFVAVDLASIGGMIAVLVCLIFALPDTLTAISALIAALANLVRQAAWRPTQVLREPILWSLHLAYLWIPLGLAAYAASLLLDVLSQNAALHLLAIGAVGGMTFTMMTRAPLGHTGRPLIVSKPIALAYGMIAIAAVCADSLLMRYPTVTTRSSQFPAHCGLPVSPSTLQSICRS